MKLKESEKLFGALADGTRLRILNLLMEGELCVCDLMKVLKAPQSKISRHLAYLRRVKLVEGRKDGLWMHYRLSVPKTRTFRAVLAALDEARSEYAELKADHGEFRRNRSCLVGCCE